MQKNIQLIYFNAGGGHRSAALALKDVIALEHPHWSISLVNLFEVIDDEGYFQKLMGFAPEDLYNFRLKKGWTRGLATELKVLQALIRLVHLKLKRKLQQYWNETQPTLVVSLIPNFNKVMYEALLSECPSVPYVTVMTDIADYPPHFWIEEGQQQHLICGSVRAVEQAVKAGYQASQITEVSGMILRPSFYQLLAKDRLGVCAEFGFDPIKPIGLVMFGGNGSTQMLRIAKDLCDQQLILICGNNAALAKKIQSVNVKEKHVVLGYSSEVARLMQNSDFFIGKPGPGSLSEAVHMGLPVITFKNALTMPQERYNTTWVLENQLGLVVGATKEVKAAVESLVAELPHFKKNVAAIQNQSVFEVVAALDTILKN